jgi:hypothetical protein
MMVITHTDSVSVPGWTGGGHIILDPEDLTGAYKISGGLDGGLLILLGMMLAFLAVAVLFFIATPMLAAIAGAAGFIGHILITVTLMDDPDASLDYAVARLATLAGSFALFAILGQFVLIAVPTLFVLAVFFAAMSVLINIAMNVYQGIASNSEKKSREMFYVEKIA